MLDPSGECFPSSFTSCSFLGSCSLFLSVLVKRFLTWAASIVDTGAVFWITPSERLQNVKKKWLWRQTETKGSLKATTGLSGSISPEDPVTVLWGQQMAEREQHGKPSGIPGKGISGSCMANEGTLLTAQSTRQSSV